MKAGGPPAPERRWRSLSLRGVWEPAGWPRLLEPGGCTAARPPSAEQKEQSPSPPSPGSVSLRRGVPP